MLPKKIYNIYTKSLILVYINNILQLLVTINIILNILFLGFLPNRQLYYINMKREKSQAVNIFDFFSYQEYLNAVYAHLKDTRIGFSHRTFARDAGIASPNYLHRVLKGERNLTLNYVPNFCKALKLNAEETKYLEALVQFNNEKSSQQKEEFLRKLLTLRYSRGEYKIQDKKLLFYSRWYYPIIRELVVIIDFKEDYNLLARSCIPRITSVQAENAVKYLVKNGFIKRDDRGRYTYANPVISTGPEVNSTILRKYHKQTISQCVDALDTIKVEDRDVSSLTMSVSKKTYLAMKKEIQDFRKRLLAMAKEDKQGEMVCYAGFQLIPKSKVHTREKE